MQSGKIITFDWYLAAKPSIPINPPTKGSELYFFHLNLLEPLLSNFFYAIHIESLKDEISCTPSEELIVSILKDFLEQLRDLKRWLSQLQSIEDQEIALPQIEDEIEDEDRTVTSAELSVSDWLCHKKRLCWRKGNSARSPIRNPRTNTKCWSKML